MLLAPLVLIGLDARSAGWAEIRRVLFRQRSLMLLEHTVTLSAIVAVLAAVIGVSAAWCTERCALPGRRLWTVLLVMPIAMPDFVVGFSWHSFAPRMNPLLAATIVMTLGTYPLVYLPVAAALRRCDPVMEDTAHSLGVGRVATFVRISLPQIRTALLGGTVLVVLTVISEYGAFEIVRFPTFTTEIFTEFQFEPQAAGALSVPLVLLGLLALSTEGLVGRRRRPAQPQSRRTPRPPRWRASTAPMMLALTTLAGLGVGVPIGTLCYWMARSQHTTLPAVATLGQATLSSVSYAAWGALLAVVAAVPVAMMSFRRRTRPRAVLESSTFVTRAVPGVVIALSLVFFATRYVFALYQTSLLLVIAYAVIHFPLALVCVKTSTAQAPARLIDVGASLGRRPLSVFFRVTLPLLAPGLLAGFCLVFLTAVTELTRDAGSGSHRSPDAGDPVLGVSERSGLWRRCALRPGDRGAGCGAGGTPRPVVRSRGSAVDGGRHVSTVEITGLTKSYGSTAVLNGVDLVIPDGGVTAILGASGSGKSTLLKLIAGFEDADAGTVTIGGQLVDDGRRTIRPQHRGVGYVPQDAALFPHLTVAGNVRFGMPRSARGDLPGLIELVGLTGFETRYPHQLSGGQQQRVALARALAIRPRVVLLDEPFGALDAALRESVRTEVIEILGRSKTTTVLVTHDQDEALSLADHVAVIDDGRIVAFGSPRELYDEPPSPAIAAAIGTANILDATITANRATCLLGELPLREAAVDGPCHLLVRPEQLSISTNPD